MASATCRSGNLSFQLQKTLDFHGDDSNNGRHFTITAANGDTLTGTLRGRYHRADSSGFRGFTANNGHVGNRSIPGGQWECQLQRRLQCRRGGLLIQRRSAYSIAWAHEPLHGIGIRYRLRWVVPR